MHGSCLRMPMIIRFPQIIDVQLNRMHEAFRNALAECSYPGKHRGVFPFKVNQRREFIDNIVSSGRRFDYGLEVGSKTELIAAMSYDITPDSLLICMASKIASLSKWGFIGRSLGKNIILVVEGPDELQTIIDIAKTNPHCPDIGFRVKLYSKGSVNGRNHPANQVSSDYPASNSFTAWICSPTPGSKIACRCCTSISVHRSQKSNALKTQ